MAPGSGTLFETGLPEGFRYQPEFITSDDEQSLVEEIARVAFSPFAMRGVIARRRVAFFGRSYETGGTDPPPIPPFLLRLRERVGTWAGIRPGAFVMALLNEYPPGAPIGWHRDAPQYDTVAGVSLLSSCRMKFRPYLRPGASTDGRRRATHEIVLEPRSAYLLTNGARAAYEHHIPAVASLRYSITFRTSRRSGPSSESTAIP